LHVLTPFVRRAARAALPLLGLTLAALLPAAGAGAQSAAAAPTLLINTHPSGLDVYGGLHYQGAIWQGVTTALGTTFGDRIARSQTLADRTALLGYDALWIDQRWHHTPGQDEIANLLAFIQTGRRVVLVGENASWGGWNGALLSMLGGQEGPLAGLLPNQGGSPDLGCQDGLTARAVDHMLTQGVRQIRMACGGYALGGTSLFNYGVATLWGADQNVLTVLDANVLDDVWLQGSNNRQFQGNVVAWVAGAPASAAVALTTPEPGTWALLGTGLLALGGIATRQKRR
jgi:hypothetical protein